MKPLHYYFIGTGSWFLAFGIQSVIFAWLVTMVLNETPDKVGFAQMALLAPTMALMLVGGSLADHYGGRRIVMLGHTLASLAPLYLTAVVVTGRLSYPAVLVFAVIMGCAQALVTPSRDGLLALVADGRIQRRVVQTSMIQFGVQMLGFVAASFADRMGATVILLIQCGLLLSGTVAYFKLEVPHLPPTRSPDGIANQIGRSVREGFRTVSAHPYMRTVVIQNCAMGVFFMGSYMVTLPLVIREVYGGSSVELSCINGANSLGLVTTILLLLRFGDLHRQGRALLTSQAIGSFALAGAGLGLGFPSLVCFLFGWGMCGGVAMTMSRTIMQEQAPTDQRGRMMAFFSFSFMGSGMVGALFSGYLCDWLGPSTALIVSSTCMVIVITLVRFATNLWHLDTSAPSIARDVPAAISARSRSR